MNAPQMPASATWNVRAAPTRPRVAWPQPGTVSERSRMRARSGPSPSLFVVDASFGALGVFPFFGFSRLGSTGSVMPVEARANAEIMGPGGPGGPGAAAGAGSDVERSSAAARGMSNLESPDQGRAQGRL